MNFLKLSNMKLLCCALSLSFVFCPSKAQLRTTRVTNQKQLEGYSTEGVSNTLVTRLTEDTVVNSVTVNQNGSSVTDRVLTCPAGFSKLGKQCMRTLIETPQVQCPPGYSLSDTQSCVRYVSRESGCPSGFSLVNGICRRQEETQVINVCPDGYLIKSDGQTCVKTVERGNYEACPVGSIQTGDVCINEIVEAPVNICPDGFKVEDNDCTIEEIYDCTPDFSGTSTQKQYVSTSDSIVVDQQTQSIVVDSTQGTYGNLKPYIDSSSDIGRSIREPTIPVTKYGSRRPLLGGTRSLGARRSSGGVRAFLTGFKPEQVNDMETDDTVSDTTSDVNDVIIQTSETTSSSCTGGQSYLVPAQQDCSGGADTFSIANPPIAYTDNHRYEDYVLNSTCSRIRREPSHRICKRGVLDGDTCWISENVDSIVIPGGLKEETIDASVGCPDNYSRKDTNSDTCVAYHDIPLTFYCPSGTQDLTDRCLMEVQPSTICSAGFDFDGSRCIQITFTQPIIEYTVQYSCVGKNCDSDNQSS